jgi:hypothetical protein
MMLLALVAVYGVGSVKPQKNIDKKNTKVTNPNALAHMNVKAKFGPRTPSFEATGSTKGTHRIELTRKDLVCTNTVAFHSGKAKGQATWVRSSLSQLSVGNSPRNVTGMSPQVCHQ